MQLSMASLAKITPLSAGGKPRVLGKLQEIPHFEKILTALNCTYNGPTVPASFVQKYGDRVRRSVILRTEPSTKAWPVDLVVFVSSPSCTQVKFGGGWNAFATSNGLLEGDSLLFALKKMSEFEVYLFRSDNPSQKWTTGSDRSAPKQSCKCRDGSVTLGKRKTGIDNSASPPSKLRNSEYLHLLPSFWKSLTASNVRVDAGYLEIPGDFWKTHGSRVHSVVKLQGIHDQSPVHSMACRTSYGKSIRHYLRAEWRAFVTENHLHQGKQLRFTLGADSFFVVREVHDSVDSCLSTQIHE